MYAGEEEIRGRFFLGGGGGGRRSGGDRFVPSWRSFRGGRGGMSGSGGKGGSERSSDALSWRKHSDDSSEKREALKNGDEEEVNSPVKTGVVQQVGGSSRKALFADGAQKGLYEGLVAGGAVPEKGGVTVGEKEAEGDGDRRGWWEKVT